MKYSVSQSLLRAVWVLLGSVLTGLGIHLIILSGFGADPLTMFEEGLAKTLGVDTGVAVWGFNMAVLALAFLVNRRDMGLGTLITAFVIGPAMTFFSGLGIPAPGAFWLSAVVNVLGVACCGLGIAVYMSADFGVGSLEALMIYIAEKVDKSYGLVRVCMDCSWGVLGLLLGGTLGLGTAVGAFGVGFFLEVFHRAIRRLLPKGESAEGEPPAQEAEEPGGA